MGMLETILGGQNNQIIAQLSRSVGLDESDVQNVVHKLLPAFSNGIKANAGNSDALGGLLNALTSGNHQQFIDKPEALADTQAVEEGNAILGQVFGSKDVSRNVAGYAAQETGVDSSIIKKLLPLVATTVIGALSKETANVSQLNQTGINPNNLSGSEASPVVDMLTSFLDADNDGDVADDLLNLAKKFF